ncbi:Alpha/Beta hydrolase protein [Gorgonomyces haynaldii]|nr:Alpha/Beta hydrolase protein [Gorgonomyces haynaldii]
MIHLESEEKQKRRKSSNGKKIEDPDKRRRSIFGGRKRDESESESENKKKKLPKKDDSDSETDKKRRKSLFGGKKDDKRRKSIEEDLPNGVPYNTFPGEEPKKPEERRPSLTFTSALDLAQERPFMVREDIRDVLHFIHYAEMAYVTLDLETESKTDLITHFSPKNDLYRSPYLVCVDHDWKCVVIAVRGTWSLKDVLTDLKLDTVGLDGPEDPKRAHSGILMTAKNIVHDLINDRVLEKLTQENGQAQGYSVVLTGHSLGGAVASLVAYFLRQRQYRRVRCYAFSPPCLLNEACMGYFDQFCMSIVCGDDVISRTNIYTLNEIKKDVERLIQECDTPKYKILGSVISNKFKGQTAKTKALIDRIQNGIQPTSAHPLEHVPKEELKRIRKTTQSLPDLWRGHEQTIIQMTQNEALQQYPLFLPGKILYIEKIRDFAAKYHVQQIHLEYDEQQQQDKSLKKLKQALMDQMEKIKERVKDYKYLYVPRWAEQKEFQYIVISKSMLSDHLPFGILNELEAFPRGKPLVTTS